MIRLPWRRIASLALALALVAGCGMTEKVEQIWKAKDSGLRKRVTIVPFSSPISALQGPASRLGKAVKADLVKGGGFIVVDYQTVLQEMNGLDPAIKDGRERLMLACRNLGVSAMLTALLTDLSVNRELTGIYGFRDNDPFLIMELNLRIIDTSSGAVYDDKALRSKIELTDVQASNLQLGEKTPPEMEAKLQEDLQEPSTKWAQSVISAMPWTGFILAAQDGRIKITVGRDTGLSLGDTVVAYTKGREIRTGSGNVLHLLGRPAGVLKLSELGPRSSWATPVPGDEDEPKPGPFEPGQVLLTK